MVTPRKNRKPVAKGKNKTDRPLTAREEYRAAMDELNRFEHNNDTAEARQARDRFDKAEGKRKWWNR